MRIQLYMIGKMIPEGIQLAVDMLSKRQTIWKISWGEALSSLGHKLDACLKAISENSSSESSSIDWAVGITTGLVDLPQDSLCFLDMNSKVGLISAYRWDEKRKPDPPEVFWAVSLANVCFRAVLSKNCETPNCLGFSDYRIDHLYQTAFEMEICEECRSALSTLYRYQVDEVIALLDALTRPASYSKELAFQKPPDLPILERQIRGLSGRLGDRVFSDFAMIIIMHFVADLVPFLEGLLKLGAKEEMLFLLVKPYPYANKTAVHSFLYEKHRNINIEFLGKGGPNDSILQEVVERCRSTSRSGKIVVIEDGGYVVPFLHRKYPDCDQFCIGAVEQTTKGLRRDQEVGRLTFPLLNVAKSKFKDEYEAPLVGQAVVQGLQNLLSDYSFNGKRALVIGFGAVGKEIAYSLRMRGMVVDVSDSDNAKLVSARVRGFRADSAVRLINEAEIIIGTTGTCSLKKEALEKVRHGGILVSASSDQIEIDLDHLNRMSDTSEDIPKVGTKYYVKRQNAMHEILLIADGFPVNFYSGAGIPNKAIDPILTQLFIGAAAVCAGDPLLKAGICEVMDELIEKAGLLEDLIAVYPQ